MGRQLSFSRVEGINRRTVDRIPLWACLMERLLNKKEVISRSYIPLERYMYIHKLKDCVNYRDIEERLYDTTPRHKLVIVMCKVD